MRNICYSFIIPHHNNPELLYRLIDSIPLRDDVEIIVVDDNSDSDKKPVQLRSDCKLLCIDAEHTKGAGKARNLGIENALGKWLLFADSDDVYADGFLNVLDVYSSKNIDILYFDVFYAWDPVMQKERSPQKYSDSIKQYLGKRDSLYWTLMVKHIIQGPWNFMVKREYVEKLKAHFEEVPKGNDAFFHHYVSMNTQSFEVTEKKLYYWLWNENGITRKRRTEDEYISELTHRTMLLNMKVEAGAWNTIPLFSKGFNKVKKDCGLKVALKWLMKSFFSNVPWIKICVKRFLMEIGK